MKQDFYKKITIRNGNTFEKIAEILERDFKPSGVYEKD